MNESIKLMSTKPTLTPNMQEMVNQTTELMKLDIIQGLIYEQEPSVFKDIKRNPSELGKTIADRLRKLSPKAENKNKDFSELLPINELYTDEIKRLIKQHNVNLINNQSIFKQIDMKEKFSFLENTFNDSKAVLNMYENLFDIRMETEEDLLSEDEVVKTMIPHLNIDPTIAKIIEDQYNGNNQEKASLSSNGNTFTPTHPTGPTKGPGSGPKAPTVNSKLNFKLHKVTCIKKTSEIFKDIMAMGATTIAPDGTTTLINEFMIGHQGYSFVTGRWYDYIPAKVIQTFTLTNTNYPASFVTILALAEKDSAGMSDFLSQLWTKVHAQVQTAVNNFVIQQTNGTWLEALVGVITAVAMWVFNNIIQWITALLKDDIFTPIVLTQKLLTNHANFNGNASSPRYSTNVQGYGGEYRIEYSWELIS